MGLIEAIVFLVFSIVVLVVGIVTKAGLDIIILGGLGVLASILFIVINCVNKKKK